MPDPQTVYRALTGYVGKDGPMREGTRLRGDHPAVVGDPKFWAPDSLDDIEAGQVFRERFPTYTAHPRQS